MEYKYQKHQVGSTSYPTANSATSYLFMDSGQTNAVLTIDTLNNKVLANKFQGDGSLLTNLPSTSGVTISQFNTYTGVTAPSSYLSANTFATQVNYNINTSGNITAVTYYGDGSKLTGISTSSSLSGLTDVTISAVTLGQSIQYDGSKWVNTYRYFSAGLLQAPIYSNNGDGTITLGQIQVSLYNNSTNIGNPYIYTISSGVTTTGVSILQMLDNDTNYIIVNYNSGSPRYEVIQDVDLINESNVIPVVTIFRNGIHIHNLNWDSLGLGLANKLNQRFVKTQRIARESGLAISTSGGTGQALGGYGDAIRISMGKTWNGAARQTIQECYSLSASTTTFFCHQSGSSGNWITETTPTGFINTQYFRISDYSLQPLSSANVGWFTVNWIYRGIEDYDHIYILLGEGGQYRYLADAQAEVTTPINIPKLISSHAILVGRIISRYGTSTSQDTKSAFDSQFPGGMINDHNSLSNLQGGTASEYYHLTVTEHNTLIKIGRAHV